SLDAYKATFNKKGDVMVLDPANSEFFKAFRGSGGAAAPPAKK
ncbi:MAG TPA: protease modulator HflC, partial [Ramlibacter sp.]|nr:protease modulator HflC [Ramlibacter sp.]